MYFAETGDTQGQLRIRCRAILGEVHIMSRIQVPEPSRILIRSPECMRTNTSESSILCRNVYPATSMHDPGFTTTTQAVTGGLAVLFRSGVSGQGCGLEEGACDGCMLLPSLGAATQRGTGASTDYAELHVCLPCLLPR